MRKTLPLSLLVAFFACVPLALSAQDAAAAADQQFTAETDHYRVYSETSQAQADDVARRMEAAVPLYNGVYHFDLSTLPTKLRVRVFKDLDSFNAYLEKILNQKRADFVFVAWSDPERSELLCFPRDDAEFTTSLLHQGAIQFVKAFVDNPPLWLREGVATFVDASPWDPKTGTYTLKPNFAWLSGLKSMVRGESSSKLIALPDLLSMTRDDAQAQMDVFAPETWGLVQFLLDTPDRQYSRVIWDAVSALAPKATLEENSQKAHARAFSWVGDDQLQKDFQAYILDLKTVPDLIREGIDLYTTGDLANAEQSFLKALDLEPGSSTAWYYQGLIAYNRKDYAKAEEEYLKAFQLGANAAIINYALGVNSFAAGKTTDAAKYLNFAKQADAPTYGDKVDTLLKRISSTK